MNAKLFEDTAKLWERAFEDGLLAGVDPQVALGAHYAKLALDGTVELTESGLKKVETSLEALGKLLD
jgi:hypothetical protein